MSNYMSWEFKLGQIVRLPSNQGKGIVVARKCIEDAEGKEFSYSVFNKSTEHSADYLQSELLAVTTIGEK